MTGVTLLIVAVALTAGCKDSSSAPSCSPSEDKVRTLGEPWQSLGVPVPKGALLCRSQTLPHNRVSIVVAGNNYSVVEEPIREKLHAAGFALDPDRTARGHAVRDLGASFDVGLHRQLFGVFINARDGDGVAHVELMTYPACPIDEMVKAQSFESRMRTLIAGDDTLMHYCRTLRSVLSDQEPEAGLAKESTVLEAPADLVAEIASARQRGGKVDVLEPAWGPAKGDPVRWAKAVYRHAAYDGVREQLQRERPKGPPIVVTVGGQRLGFFSAYGTWLGTFAAIGPT